MQIRIFKEGLNSNPLIATLYLWTGLDPKWESCTYPTLLLGCTYNIRKEHKTRHSCTIL